MGSGMSKILPGLYVGNFRDAKDQEQLKTNNITHILSIHDNAKKILEDKEYLIILASDSPYQDLTQFFPQCVDFIHKARLSGGGCIVHCLAGVSRSVTVTAAYLMTVTNLGWRDALNAIRGARNVANPNFGFQRQLQTYQNEHLEEARRKFREQYPDNNFKDEEECRLLLQSFKHYVLTGESMSSAPPPKDEHDGLYPLPHDAYSSKRHSKMDPDSPATTSTSTCASSSTSTATSPTPSIPLSTENQSGKDSEPDVSDTGVSEMPEPESVSSD